MTAPLTDEHVARAVRLTYDGAGVIALAREVRVGPDCVCGASHVRCGVIQHGRQCALPPLHGGDCDLHDFPCPDCTDGKMPLDHWVALLVRTLNESRIALSAATTIGERHRTPLNYGNHDRLVANIDAVLKMVPKVSDPLLCPRCGGKRDLRCGRCGGSASLPLGMTCEGHDPKLWCHSCEITPKRLIRRKLRYV